MGVLSILTTATNIFPAIKIPIIAVTWRDTGLLSDEMADRIVRFPERTAQTVLKDVEHTESQSVNGTAVDSCPAGIVTHLEVASTETTALQAELSRINIQTRRLTAAVLLIKALRGGWFG